MSSDSNERYKQREWLHNQYWGLQKSIADVAETADVATATIRRYMNKHDIETRSLAEANAKGDISKLQDRDWLYSEYVKNQRSTIDIANELDLANDTVLKWLNNHGIKVRTRSEARSKGDVEKLHEETWLQTQYIENERDGPEIATELNVDTATVYSWLRKHGIEIRSVSEARIDGEYEQLQNETWLREKYVELGLSTRDIADLLDVSKGSVTYHLRQHGIEVEPSPPHATDADMERLDDPEYLREKYHAQTSAVEIAEELNCHTATVHQRLRQFGIAKNGHEWGHPSGQDHPQFKEKFTNNYGPNWPKQRLKARKRDQCRCQVCGKTDSEHKDKWGQVNHVHHIQPLRTFVDDSGCVDYERANAIENLITLCTTHHQKLEGVPIDNR